LCKKLAPPERREINKKMGFYSAARKKGGKRNNPATDTIETRESKL
jgi:hypothetical protein